jgi:hypothetical protein
MLWAESVIGTSLVGVRVAKSRPVVTAAGRGANGTFAIGPFFLLT